jgi:DNA polymerase-3 subunit alpha
MNFVDLHAHSTYSLLDAYGTPIQLAERAKELGRKSLAITDHGSVSGWVQFNKACVEAEIKPIFGYEAYVVDSVTSVKEEKSRKRNHITLLAENNIGYKNILKLATLAYENFYYFPIIDWDILSKNSEGVIVLSGCWTGKLQKLLVEDNIVEAENWIKMMKTSFGDRFYLETQHYDLHLQTFDKLKLLSEKYSVPIVLTCDVHYQTEGQANIQEILHAIRDRRFFDENNLIEGAYQWDANALFTYVNGKFLGNWNEIFKNINDVAERCNAGLEKGGFPSFITDSGLTSKEIMKAKCKEGIKRLGLEGAGKVYKDRFQREFNLIEEKEYIDYILIASDLIEWSKDNGVLVGSGRGSSAGSLICYLLGITMLDPIKYDLLFERFIDETRIDPPDIDTDFDATRRDLTKEYAKQKYGEDKVCDIATFARFKGKNSLDEIGKMFKIPKAKVETVKEFLIERSGGDVRAELTILDTFEMTPEAKEVSIEYPDILKACLLEGQLRHLSVHAAGVLISTRSLTDVLAMYRKKDKEDGERTIGSFEMKDSSELDLIKVDFLGLTELSIQREIYEMAGKNMLEIYDIPLNDSETLKSFNKADVQGVFQYSGDSTKNILRQMPEVDFEQLIACLTLSRPGPAYSGSATKYISKMSGKEGVESFDWHPILKNITINTYGQIIYQEQIIRILKEFANFSTIDANKCRILISKSKGEQEFQKYFPVFERETKGKITDEQVLHLWESIKVFGRYTFNRSHAASYALVGYWSMFLKTYYTDEFYVCKLNHEKDESNKLRLLMDASKKGYIILPPMLGKSDVFWKIEGKKCLRAGLVEIKGIGEKTAKLLVSNNFRTREDFEEKKVRGVNIRALKSLDEINGFSDSEAYEGDYFNIHAYDSLDIIAPNRIHLEKIKDWDKSYRITIAGRFVEMKYKDIFEEKASRGQSTDNIRDPEKAKYSMMVLEDETDRSLVQIDRYLFDKIEEDIWKAYREKMLVVVDGQKVKGWRMIRAARVTLFSSEEIAELTEYRKDEANIKFKISD